MARRGRFEIPSLWSVGSLPLSASVAVNYLNTESSLCLAQRSLSYESCVKGLNPHKNRASQRNTGETFNTMGPPKTEVLTKRDNLHLDQLSSYLSLGTGWLHHTFSVFFISDILRIMEKSDKSAKSDTASDKDRFWPYKCCWHNLWDMSYFDVSGQSTSS